MSAPTNTMQFWTPRPGSWHRAPWGARSACLPGVTPSASTNSNAQTDVRAGESTSVPAGTLVVHGSTDEYYAVLSNAGVQLASAHLEKPFAFVPGTYNGKVNETTTPA